MGRDQARGEVSGVAGAAVVDGPAPVPAPVVERQYFIGLTSLCPFERLSVCGQEFCLRTEAVNFKAATGETQRLEQRGRVVRLSDAKVAKIRAKALKMMIERTEVTPDPVTGARRQIGNQWDTESATYDPTTKTSTPDYVPRPNHQPFAAYMYIQAVPDGLQPNRDIEPPTIIPFRED